MTPHPNDDAPTKGGEDVWVSLGLGDPDRIAALERYRILDTPADEAFDSLVRLASQLCGTPVGLITLVASDRQ